MIMLYYATIKLIVQFPPATRALLKERNAMQGYEVKTNERMTTVTG
jgi:hypothetical protein